MVFTFLDYTCSYTLKFDTSRDLYRIKGKRNSRVGNKAMIFEMMFHMKMIDQGERRSKRGKQGVDMDVRIKIK